MRRNFFIILIVIIIALLAFLGIYQGRRNGVAKFGPLKLGGIAPLGPGDGTFYPYRQIPQSKFYIFVVQKDLGDCIFEDCDPYYGKAIETMGGWLEGVSINQPDTADMFGLDKDAVVDGKSSIVIIMDNNSELVGIYPNKTTRDLISLLKLHQKLIEKNCPEGNEICDSVLFDLR